MKRKNWWEVYGEKKNSILKREEIVEPEEEAVEVIKENDDSDNRVTEVKPTEERYLGKGGIRTRPGSI